ncbi:MAG: helix-turn-helix transcriptional regulator [Clostridia bacterium]|nr:helix-turn-helix transcriptional regulator [Clostridia bacterium]
MELKNDRIYSYGEYFERKLYRGDILFRPPGGVVESVGAQSTYIVTLDFSGKAVTADYSRNLPGKIQPLCEDALISRFLPIIRPININGIMRIYENLINLADKNSPAARELVLELLYSVNAEISKRNYERLKPVNNACETALLYMRQNADKQITLEELSNLVHLEKSYFVRLFRQTTGKTPIEALISIRLDKANDLIANTDMKICDIAPLCGYNTVSFFISSYKERYGVTPREHRRNSE